MTSQEAVISEICEALDCNAKATTEAYIKAGHYGLIPLSLCNECLNKFDIIEIGAGSPTKQTSHSTDNTPNPGELGVSYVFRRPSK